jgi:Zn-dependent alcohol dehydrogenase
LGAALFERADWQSLTPPASKMQPLDGHVSHGRARGALMKRVQYLHYGAPEELRLDEVTPPDAGRGQIRVQVRAAAANPMDWKIRRGEMKALSGYRFPRGLGHDFAGVVEAVGPGVERLQAGDEVFDVPSIRQAGAFAEYVVADEMNVGLKPPSISFERAAALTLVSVTVWNALVAKARLRAGQSVFITGCLGGVERQQQATWWSNSDTWYPSARRSLALNCGRSRPTDTHRKALIPNPLISQ